MKVAFHKIYLDFNEVPFNIFFSVLLFLQITTHVVMPLASTEEYVTILMKEDGIAIPASVQMASSDPDVTFKVAGGGEMFKNQGLNFVKFILS